MLTSEERAAQQRELKQKMHGLQTYEGTLRHIGGEIHEIEYRKNSGLSCGEQQRKADLESRRRETMAALRKEYPDITHSLTGIRKAITQSDMALTRIEMQQEDRERLAGLETRLTESGIDLLTQQAELQTLPLSHERTPSPREPHQTTYEEQYEQAIAHHPTRQQEHGHER